MIVVDSSVWVDFFNGKPTPETTCLDALLLGEPVAVGDLILVEVLQGFRSDADFERARSLLTHLPCIKMLGTQNALLAAQNFRLLRRRGITVRKTIDVVIATCCIVEGCRLLSADRDFLPFAQHLGLELWRPERA